MGNAHNDNNDDFDKLLPRLDGLPSPDELDDAEAERLFAAAENGNRGALDAINTLSRKRHEEAVARGDVEEPAPWRVLPQREREPTFIKIDAVTRTEVIDRHDGRLIFRDPSDGSGFTIEP